MVNVMPANQGGHDSFVASVMSDKSRPAHAGGKPAPIEWLILGPFGLMHLGMVDTTAAFSPELIMSPIAGPIPSLGTFMKLGNITGSLADVFFEDGPYTFDHWLASGKQHGEEMQQTANQEISQSLQEFEANRQQTVAQELEEARQRNEHDHAQQRYEHEHAMGGSVAHSQDHMRQQREMDERNVPQGQYGHLDPHRQRDWHETEKALAEEREYARHQRDMASRKR